MLHSMTGFARQSVDTEFGALTWELRAVNHRYLDVQFKLPDEFRPQEQAFRQQVGDSLKRGKIECAFRFRRGLDASSEMQLNDELVKLLSTRLASIASVLHDADKVDPIDILRWPGVIQQSEIEVEPLFQAISDLLTKSIEAMLAMRASEGLRIASMLESRCADIASLATSVRARMPKVLDAVRKKQQERIDRLDVDANPERLELELALIAQKIDVDEELDRLDSHIAEIRETLAKDEPVGRRLDFLMQELNREANTLGSKSVDAEVSKISIELKVLIEQMREQVQNIE